MRVSPTSVSSGTCSRNGEALSVTLRQAPPCTSPCPRSQEPLPYWEGSFGKSIMVTGSLPE